MLSKIDFRPPVGGLIFILSLGCFFLSSCSINQRIWEDAQNALDSEYADLKLQVVDSYNMYLGMNDIANLQKFRLYLSDQKYPPFWVVWYSKSKVFENLRFMYEYNRRSVLRDSLINHFYTIAPNYSTLTFDADYSDSLLWKASIYMFDGFEKDSIYKLDVIKAGCDWFATKYNFPRFEAEAFFVDTTLFPSVYNKYFVNKPFENFSEYDNTVFCKCASGHRYFVYKNRQGRIVDSLGIADGWMAMDTIRAACNRFMEGSYPKEDYHKRHDISLKLDPVDFNAVITNQYLITQIENEKRVERGTLTGKYDLKTKQTKIKNRTILPLTQKDHR